MKNRTINLGVVAEIANALGELNESVVFVGGAVVSVYADDTAADEVRPTQDVDLTLTLVDIDQHRLDNRLAELGFHPDLHGHAICSYRYKDIAVDIMAATDTMRGPTNRWYQVGFESIQKIEVQDTPIQILPAPCYLATKFEAFNHRGQGDYRTSHDFEDIIYVIDNRTTIVEEIKNSGESIQGFLKSEIQKILSNKYVDEILSAHLHPLIEEQRYPLLLDKLKRIVV
ncbi:hypothetical protein [Arenicella xantha]|uniref:Nucleotidyltransferase AbiEii toxin of type IV toxin-antitoxin system n=1 Tax=Arenicella xantha TaxID=644221 RepID=A0A395JKL6_9GAMM|nr:hypothetical protein [Arenicella xantha]RBP51333.1 hypothetical protein DFR28_102753 [Arenicella xantha]